MSEKLMLIFKMEKKDYVRGQKLFRVSSGEKMRIRKCQQIV